MNSKGITIDDEILEILSKFDDTPKKEISDWFSCYKDQVLMPDDIVSAYMEALCRISTSCGVVEFVQRVSDPTRHEYYMWFTLLSADSKEFTTLRRIYESHVRKGIVHLCELYTTLKRNVDDTLKSPENSSIKALFETPLSAHLPKSADPLPSSSSVDSKFPSKVYSWGPPKK